MQHKRFIDNGTYLRQFMGNIFVVCPKCGRQATVTCPDPPRCLRTKTAVCTHCGFNEKTNHPILNCGNNKKSTGFSWKGPVIGIVSRRCGYCGRHLQKQVRGPIRANTTLLKCPGCGYEMSESINWRPTTDGKALDPFFGLKLWFVRSVRGNELWAYNREHLNFIKRLVEATHREQRPHSNGTLSNRLPKWMLNKKNRPHVLKAIQKLETPSE